MVFLFVHYVEGSFGDLYVDLFEFMEMFVFFEKRRDSRKVGFGVLENL